MAAGTYNAASCLCEQCRTLRAYNKGYLGSKDTAEILLRRVDDAKSGPHCRSRSEDLAEALRRVREDAMIAGYNARVTIGPSTYANALADWSIDSYFPRIKESARPAQTYSANSGSAGRFTVDDMNAAIKRLRNYNATIEFRIDPTAFYQGYFKKSEEKPMSSSNAPTPQGIINDLHRLKDDADLSEIKGNLSKIEAERKARIEKALAGQADLAILTGTSAKRFIAVYWHYGAAKSAEGTEYPVKYDADGDPTGYSVILDEISHPFRARYESMEKFRKFFDDNGYPYHIAYFDQ